MKKMAKRSSSLFPRILINKGKIKFTFFTFRWRKAASKNAYVLLGQKKYLLSAAFFYLANNLPVIYLLYSFS